MVFEHLVSEKMLRTFVVDDQDFFPATTASHRAADSSIRRFSRAASPRRGQEERSLIEQTLGD